MHTKQTMNDGSREKGAKTQYEINQNFNFIIAWFHSLRYKNVIAVLKAISHKSNAEGISVIEIGCAHAKLYAVLSERFRTMYTGIEIEPSFVKIARERYGHNPCFSIIHDSAIRALAGIRPPDVIIALETLEHIAEADVVEIVRAVAAARPGLFVCSVPVEVGPAIWLKNIGSWLMGYMRHTEYRWAETFWAGLYRLDKLPSHTTGHKGFDWRWLAQTISQNMRIIEIRKFPLFFLPASLSTSVFIVAEPRPQ